MFNIKQTIKKTYKTQTLRSNIYDLQVKEDLVGLRFDLKLSQEEVSNQVDESIVTKHFQMALKHIFGWFSVSGKTLYAFKSKEAKVLPFTTSCGVTISQDHEEGEGYFLSIPCKGKENLTLMLSPAGRDLHFSQLKSLTCDHSAELIMFANIWFGSIMKDLQLNELGGASGKYFDTSKAIGTALGELDIFQGYKISPDRYQGGKFKLLLDKLTRVISKTTLWDQWNNSEETEREFIDRHTGMSFVDVSTNRNIRIDGFELNSNPSKAHTSSEYATIADYYKYGLCVKGTIDMTQFLVYSEKKTFIKKEGEKDIKLSKKTYYLPQFLRSPGMTNDQKSNHKMMKAVAEYTKLEPDNREKE